MQATIYLSRLCAHLHLVYIGVHIIMVDVVASIELALADACSLWGEGDGLLIHN